MRLTSRFYWYKNFLLCILCALILATPFAKAQTEVLKAPDLEEMVITASRYYQSPFEVASSIDLINRTNIQDTQQQINISESLSRVPGIQAMNRQNYAQDTMISIRGFGANSAFGARGIKVYVDGIPATMPDGQSQLSHIDLSSVESIEVLRGPFSVLYGNSAGGVVNIQTEKGEPGTTLTPYSSYGSFNTSKLGVKASGYESGVNYLLDVNNLNTSGSRTHSEASRDNENAKIIFGAGQDTQISVIGNRVNLFANDPLGLTASQLITNPQGAGTNAESWNTRKTVTQLQGGMELLQKLNSESGLKLMVYTGTRNQFQYQAPSSQTTPFVNGAISLDRSYSGFDAQYQLKTSIKQMPFKMTFGINYGNDNDHSMGYCNSYGALVNCIGKNSSINTDANYQAKNLDQYLQIEVDPMDKVNISLGLRNTSTQLSGNDNLNTWSATNKTYNNLLPMVSVSYLLNSLNRLYTSLGIGYDTPSLNQIKYSCGNTGCTTASSSPNMLDAATTLQYEIGWKSKVPEIGNFNVALFMAKSNNEIVALNNISGKTVYQNANTTARTGLELFGHFDVSKNWYSNIAYTYTMAQVTQDYQSAVGGVISAGTSIPGVSAHRLFSELAWQLQDHSLNIGAEMIAASNMFATDTNAVNSSAGGYVIGNLRAFAKQYKDHWSFTEIARINNIFDTYYIGSVIINQASAQFFEPSPGRNWFIGANASYQF